MTRLEIRNLEIKVHLGCTAEERQVPQNVRFSVNLIFSNDPVACKTDRLEDTICYAKICEVLRSVAAQQEYATVERLSQLAIQALKPILPSEVKGQLSVHKVKPPIDNLLDGVIFTREIN